MRPTRKDGRAVLLAEFYTSHMAKVGRPRLPASKLSKEGAWKRGQRELPSRPGYIRHHHKHGSFAPPTSSNSSLVPRSQHPKLHAKRQAIRAMLKK